MTADPLCLRCGTAESVLGRFFCQPCCDIVDMVAKPQKPPAPPRKLGADPGRNYTKKGILR